MNGRLVSSTGETLPGGHVWTYRNGAPVGTVTDGNGRWSFPFQPGEVLNASFVGYDTLTTRPLTATDSDWTLILEPSTLPGFEVVAYRVPWWIGLVLVATGVTVDHYARR